LQKRRDVELVEKMEAAFALRMRQTLTAVAEKNGLDVDALLLEHIN
jgi:hypothetical protein